MSKRIQIWKILLVILLVFSFLESNAQYKVKKKPYDRDKQRQKTAFERSQWWLGARFSTNLNQPSVSKSFNVYTPVSSTAGSVISSYQKKYNQYTQAGLQFGISLTYNFWKGLSATFQPNFNRTIFQYSYDLTWLDSTDPNNKLNLKYLHTHTLDYLEFPLTFRWEFLREKRLKPYVQAGGYYSFLTKAQKQIDVTGTDFSTGNKSFTNNSITISNNNLFNNQIGGIILGGGLNADFGNLRISLECNYRLGLSNVVNSSGRYSDGRLVGLGDVLDDVKLNNLEISLGFLFPLKYIISDLKSVKP